MLGGLESWELSGILRLAKAKRSKNFNKDFLFNFLTRFCESQNLGGESKKAQIIKLSVDSPTLASFGKLNHIICAFMQSNIALGGMELISNSPLLLKIYGFPKRTRFNRV